MVSILEFPETRLVRKTFIIREMDLPPEVLLTKRSMLRWFALSFGLISEKESRDTIFEVLDALFFFQLQKGIDPSAKELVKQINSKAKKPISEKLLRYHLNRLAQTNLLQRKKTKYSFNPSPYADRNDIKSAFNYWVREHLEKSLKDSELVLERLQKNYQK